MSRFSRGNPKHPTYLALAELGKVIKTIFLCRYLDSEALRQEIHLAAARPEAPNFSAGRKP